MLSEVRSLPMRRGGQDNPGTPKTVPLGSGKYLVARQQQIVTGSGTGHGQIVEDSSRESVCISLGKGK